MHPSVMIFATALLLEDVEFRAHLHNRLYVIKKFLSTVSKNQLGGIVFSMYHYY